MSPQTPSYIIGFNERNTYRGVTGEEGGVTGEEGEMGEVTLTGEVASSGKAKRFFFRCSPLDGWCSLLARFGATWK